MNVNPVFPSFRAKIALWTLVFSGIVLIGVTLFAYFLVSRQKTELLDTQLMAFANRLPANPAGRTGLQRLEQAREWFFGEQLVYLSVRNREGTSLFRSADWPESIPLPASAEVLPGEPEGATVLPPQANDYRRGPPHGGGIGRQGLEGGIWRFETLAADSGHWRIGVFSTAGHEYRILVSLADVNQDLATLRWRLAAILLPAMLLLAGGGWVIAGRAIRPLDNISIAAEKIVDGQLSERIAPAAEAPEIDRIIGLLNQMLDRLETNYRQALRFSADASHELKTPITLMQNALINHLDSVSPEGPEAPFCSDMLEHLSRIKKLTEGLLLLARADAGQLPRAPKTVDLAVLCRELCADIRSLPEIEHAEGAWDESIPETLTATIDPSFARTTIFNLLINAVRYSGRPARIRVELSEKDDTVYFAITNNGDPIDPAEVGRIFTRFYRGSNASESETRNRDTASGSGLGLAIARELANALGGDVALRHSRPDSTCFEFSFPRQTPTVSKMNKN